MLSRRSKYSQSSVLQKSSLFNTMLHPSSKAKDEKKTQDVEEEEQQLRLTLDTCGKKRKFLNEAIAAGRNDRLRQARNLMKKLETAYPL